MRQRWASTCILRYREHFGPLQVGVVQREICRFVGRDCEEHEDAKDGAGDVIVSTAMRFAVEQVAQPAISFKDSLSRSYRSTCSRSCSHAIDFQPQPII